MLGLFIAAKSVCEQMQCEQSSWGVDVRGQSLWEVGPVLLLEQVPLQLAQQKPWLEMRGS